MIGKWTLGVLAAAAIAAFPLTEAQVNNLVPNVNQQAGPVVLYRQNFNVQGQIGAEWSTTQTTTTPGNGCNFCGRYLGEFGPQTVTLSLGNLATDRLVLVRFNLFLLKTWDGDGQHGFGPDTFSLTSNNLGLCVELQNGIQPAPLVSPRTCGNNMLSATFANTGQAPAGCHALIPTQGYPVLGSAPGRGSVAKDTLGFGGCGDTVYEFTFLLRHTGATLTLNFTGGAVQGVADESWGLDNVLVLAL